MLMRDWLREASSGNENCGERASLILAPFCLSFTADHACGVLVEVVGIPLCPGHHPAPGKLHRATTTTGTTTASASRDYKRPPSSVAAAFTLQQLSSLPSCKATTTLAQTFLAPSFNFLISTEDFSFFSSLLLLLLFVFKCPELQLCVSSVSYRFPRILVDALLRLI